MCWKRNTSWTRRTSTPKNRSATKNVENCPLVSASSDLRVAVGVVMDYLFVSAVTSVCGHERLRSRASCGDRRRLGGIEPRGQPGDRFEHRFPVELRLAVLETRRLAGSCLDLLRRISQRQDRDRLPLRPPAHGGEQRGAAVGRKIERRYHEVHRLLLQPANHLVQVCGLEDPVAGHVQAAPDQTPRERRAIGDEDPLAVCGPARALEPIRRGRMNDLVEIEEIRDLLAHHRRAEKALAASRLAYRDGVFRDIQDLVDHHAQAALAIVEHDHLHGIGGLVLASDVRFQYGPERNQWENAVPVLHYLAAARMLDGRLRELLEPGDQRKRNGQALERTGPEQEQPLLLDARLRLVFRRRARLIAGFGQHPGTLADTEHVEDEGYAAVAHDGRAGVYGEPFQLLAQRLDHDFLGVVDAVHHQSELPVFGLQDHHADRLGPLGRFEAEHLIQVGDRQKTPTPAVYRCALHILDVLFRRISLQTDQFEQADLGDHESFATARDHQAGNDSQREWDFDLDRGAFAGPAEQVDNAADFLDVRLHHIHADPASRNVGDGFRQGEAGQEDQVQGLPIAQPLGLLGPQKPLLEGLLFDTGDVNPRPVVADFDVDLAAFVIGAKGQPAL